MLQRISAATNRLSRVFPRSSDLVVRIPENERLIQFSADGTILLTEVNNRRLMLRRVTDGLELHSFPVLGVARVLMSANHAFLLVDGGVVERPPSFNGMWNTVLAGRGRWAVWHVPSRTLMSWTPDDLSPRATFTPDGMLLLDRLSPDSRWIVRESENGKPAKFVMPLDDIECLAFSDQCIASKAYDGSVSLWTMDGERTLTLSRTFPEAVELRFSPDGGLLSVYCKNERWGSETLLYRASDGALLGGPDYLLRTDVVYRDIV
jgi:WD40 repeat protein